MPAIVFPVNIVSAGDRLRYLAEMQENLRLLHNKVSGWSSSGLTKIEYDALPAKVREQFPHSQKLPAAKFKWYRRALHDTAQSAISAEIGKLKEAIKSGGPYAHDLDEILPATDDLDAETLAEKPQ